MADIEITHPDEVTEALCSESLAPPAAPASLGDGPTAELRDAMARFSHGPLHRARRTAVESAVDRLDLAELTALARRHTAAVLGQAELGQAVRGQAEIEALGEVGLVVPTRVMAEALGTAEAELEDVRADVLAVVSAIGRQEPASGQTDLATDRLMRRFADHPDGPVAAISLLYQNHDATAALLTSVVVASAGGRGVGTGQSGGAQSVAGERRAALPRTVRVATAPVVVGTTAIDGGDTVILSLDSAANEFGAGPHQCPGRAAAEAIVAGVAAELAAAGYRLDVDALPTGADGRPTSLPMTRRGGLPTQAEV